MKAALLVIDSFGIGALPDAGDYGDEGSNTALHICQNVPVVHLPNLTRLGLGNCSGILGNPLPGVPAQSAPLASCGVMREMSSGKDTTTGHWELAGIILDKPFHTFPAQAPSFPEEILGPFRQTFRLDVLGNKSASGVEIIGRLGEEHARTGHPIIYTSARFGFASWQPTRKSFHWRGFMRCAGSCGGCAIHCSSGGLSPGRLWVNREILNARSTARISVCPCPNRPFSIC